MGIGGISIVQLIIIFAIILLIFGGKRLRNLGSDLGTTIKGFKKAMTEEESKKNTDPNHREHIDSKDDLQATQGSDTKIKEETKH